MTKAVF